MTYDVDSLTRGHSLIALTSPIRQERTIRRHSINGGEHRAACRSKQTLGDWPQYGKKRPLAEVLRTSIKVYNARQSCGSPPV